ncbi:MAG: tetratricopeptide repeat protein [Steroidobacteraceae bacterium]
MTGYQRALACLQQGRLDQVQSLCAEILQTDHRHFAALHLLGLASLQGGNAARGIELMRHSIAINPHQPDVHVNIGNALLRLRQPLDALVSCDAALALKPDYADAWIKRCSALRALNRRDEALGGYAQLLRIEPRHLEALHLRATLLMELDRLDDALADFDAAIQMGAASAAIHVNRGNALFRLGRLPEALTSYDAALALAPNDADAAFNRGNALLKLGRWPEALASYDAVVARRPGLAKGHYYRGTALRRLQRPTEALASFERALAINPHYRDGWCGCANALRDLGRFTESLSAYDRTLELDPRSLEALSNRGRVLLSLNRPAEAAESLERLFEIDPVAAPAYNFALGNRLHARLMCCDWRDFEAAVRDIFAGVEAGQRVTLPSLFVATSDSAAAQLKCARTFVDDNWTADGLTPWSGRRYRHEKIRLAYVSADFREHPVALLMAGIFEAHDRERFETTAISLRPQDGSAVAGRIRGAFGQFAEVTGQTDAEAVAFMREREIDIAVDLTGYTDGFRPGIFARRAAPIQVNYLGYPGTLAANYMDYLIADRTVIPETDRAFYTEQIVYLPECYQPNDAGRAMAEPGPTRLQCALPGTGFVFCCFNNHYKILPPMFGIWMRLLRGVDGSVLWLAKKSDAVMGNLRREAQARGVSPERLVFAPRLPSLQDHLARYPLADLFLDTLPFNAHTTASDALWAGLPVLTCRGGSFAARVAASLLNTVGLPELITHNLQEYESLALRLANSPAQLMQLRTRLAINRLACPLFDTLRLCRHLEAAYTGMWERWQRGDAPESFQIPPLP